MNKDYTEISFNFPYQNTFYFNIVVFQKIWYLSNINIILSTIRLKNIPLNHNIMNNVVLGTVSHYQQFDLRHHGPKRCVLRHNADYTILQFTLKCTNIMKKLVRWQNRMRVLLGPHFVFAHIVLVIGYLHWKIYSSRVNMIQEHDFGAQKAN